MSVGTGDLALFLKELEALSRKHGFYIDGCNCCYSPWACELTEPQLAGKLAVSLDDDPVEPGGIAAECIGWSVDSKGRLN